MPSITLRNIPDPIYEKLKALAGQNRRSLNSEALTRLEESIGAPRPNVQTHIERVRDLRKMYKGPALTPEAMEAAINHGRRL